MEFLNGQDPQPNSVLPSVFLPTSFPHFQYQPLLPEAQRGASPLSATAAHFWRDPLFDDRLTVSQESLGLVRCEFYPAPAEGVGNSLYLPLD
jgi:hypothetical protein